MYSCFQHGWLLDVSDSAFFIEGLSILEIFLYPFLTLEPKVYISLHKLAVDIHTL